MYKQRFKLNKVADLLGGILKEVVRKFPGGPKVKRNLIKKPQKAIGLGRDYLRAQKAANEGVKRLIAKINDKSLSREERRKAIQQLRAIDQVNQSDWWA